MKPPVRKPVKSNPPRRKKPKTGPLGGTVLGVSTIGKPKRGGGKVRPGRPAKPPTSGRRKPKTGPLGGTTLGVSVLGKPKKGKGKPTNPGKIVQRRGAMSRMKRK